MKRLHSILGMAILALSAHVAWAQENSATSKVAVDQSAPPEPTPAYGQENAPRPISENPPISGLDTPSLEPHAAPLSYLQPGATISQSGDSNGSSNLVGQSAQAVSRAL